VQKSVPIYLTDRQQQVLRATVRHYIATAEPVGSKAIAEEYNLNASPATIRNAMGGLEKVGLLYQPHTSAGRVPSDSGYRVYVDQFIVPSPELAQKVESLLIEQLKPKSHGLESLLRRAAQILSSLSGYITLVTLPQTTITYLRHVQLVQVDPGRIMLVMVTNTYETQSVLMELPALFQDELDANTDIESLERELQILSNFLNSQLRGQALSSLANVDARDLDREFQQYGDFLKLLLGELSRRSQPTAYTQIVMSGVAEVLRHPEFSELQQVQVLLQLLEEEQEQLWSLIFGISANSCLIKHNQRVNVWIGSENPLEPMRGCALVTATYNRDKVPVGSIGMLGPTRMVYENAITLVEAAADYLSDTLSSGC
jgi:heat-inducible transcriptional repressor